MTFFDFTKGRKPAPAPDPCAYDIPSSLGGPRFTLHQRPEAPCRDYNPDYILAPSTLSRQSCTIGPRCAPARAPPPTPGPALVATTIGGPRPAIRRRAPARASDTPGPGSYTLPAARGGPAYTVGVGRRNTFLVETSLVPPGTYDTPAPLDERRALTISRRVREPFRRRGHAGPIYDVTSPIGAGGRMSAFPQGPRELPVPAGPGPGAYDHALVVGRGSRLSPRMRERIPAREPERNQMPYYAFGPCLRSAKASMLGRPATKYETMSPGPRYHLAAALATQRMTIGVRTPHRDPRAANPAPDSYWQRAQPPVPPPINGLVGPEDRCPVNLAHEAGKPGPGYYETSDIFDTTGKGFTVQSKPPNDVRPDTAPPYYAGHSTLAGPLYTIGLKDV